MKTKQNTRSVFIALLLLTTCLFTHGAEPAAPTWYVFKIKELRKVTPSEDKKSTLIKGVTQKGTVFKVKCVWMDIFRETHSKYVESWMKKSKEDFPAGVPYVISGEVLSRDPLTIQPDTVVAHADKFGAPAENVY